MTPNAIEILIHFHACSLPHPRRGAPAVEESIREFISSGMIVQDAENRDCYRTTDRGRAHIEQLCELPLPTQAWIGANGEVIDI